MFDFVGIIVSYPFMVLWSWNTSKMENNDDFEFQGSHGSPPAPPPATNWGWQEFYVVSAIYIIPGTLEDGAKWGL